MFAKSSPQRRQWGPALAFLVLALLTPGCFKSLNPLDIATVQCQVTDDCPAGYVCRYPGRVGGCCRPNDLTCGVAVDASQSEVQGPVTPLDGSLDQEQPIDGRADSTGLGGESRIMDAPTDLGTRDTEPGSDVHGGDSEVPGVPLGGPDASDASVADLAPTCQSSVDGTPCGDGMVCRKGSCVACAAGGSCPLSNPCHKGTWSCSTGTQVCMDNGNALDGTDCGGGNVCQAGACTTCVAGQSCPLPGKPCRAGILTCSAGIASCTDNGAGNEGGTCDDGNACTKTDKCQNGQCVGSNPVTCTASDQCHVAGTCNPSTGVCSNPTGNEGGACTDPSTPCLIGKTCASGVCSGGTTKSCPASDLCHDPGTCDPSTGNCSNPVKTCTPTNQCYQAGCNPSTGCTNTVLPNNPPCVDTNPCTINDYCANGTCLGGNPVQCLDNAPCYPTGTCSATSTTAYTCTYSPIPLPDYSTCIDAGGFQGQCITDSLGNSHCLLL